MVGGWKLPGKPEIGRPVLFRTGGGLGGFPDSSANAMKSVSNLLSCEES